MAKVHGLHEIELNPGVDHEEFEKFITGVAFKAAEDADTKFHLLKGDRRTRNGKYLVWIEIASVEIRDRDAPNPEGPLSDEMQEFMRQTADIWDRWRAMATMPSDNTIFTDYVEVER